MLGKALFGTRKSRPRAWGAVRLVARLTGLGCVLATLGFVLVDCSSGSNNTRAGGSGVGSTTNLTAANVQTIILQAANEATARGTPATIAVVDRVGNVLGVMQMSGAATTLTVTSQPIRSVATSGLENKSGIPTTLAAIAKAVTGAYLSSNGNAFTTRTASQIIQENFNPGTQNQAGGPLFGVQFSQLPCSDLVTDFNGSGTLGGAPGPGPHRSPLGLAADPGGLPLYISGTLVGGIGVIADTTYGLSQFPQNGFDNSGEELIALAGQSGFTPPDSIKANLISVGGLTLRYTDADTGQLAAKVSATGSYSGTAVTGYYAGGSALDGTTFLTQASGIVRDPGNYPGVEAYVLVDNAGNQRFPPTAGAAPAGSALSVAEVKSLITQALSVAVASRAQIRQPLNSFVQVTVSIVDVNGNVLGVARTPDAPIFGTDVSLQKARTAAFLSRSTAAAEINAADSSLRTYITQSQAAGFLGSTGFANGLAFSARAIGNLARPFYPDGINGNSNGPLSRAFASWSPFTDGLQLDLIAGNVLAQAGGSSAPASKCGGPESFASTGGAGLPQVGIGGKTALANGLQIFAGGVPLYRGSTLIGAIGVSGDGIDQDDMVSFLGAARAGGGIGNAPTAIRADTLNPGGLGNLRYVNCPFSPFLGSTDTNVCAGL